MQARQDRLRRQRRAKEGACPTSVIRVGGCHPPHTQARSPPSSPGHTAPPGPCQYQLSPAVSDDGKKGGMLSTREWCQPASQKAAPCQPGPLPQDRSQLPALSPSGTWPLLGCLIWLLLCPNDQPHCHQAASLPLLCFPLLPCWEKRWGIPAPLAQCLWSPVMDSAATQTKSCNYPLRVKQSRWGETGVAPVQEHGGSPFHPLFCSWAPSQASLGIVGHPLFKTTQSCRSLSFHLSILRKQHLNEDASARP